jgi:hypothetical protein
MLDSLQRKDVGTDLAPRGTRFVGILDLVNLHHMYQVALCMRLQVNGRHGHKLNDPQGDDQSIKKNLPCTGKNDTISTMTLSHHLLRHCFKS